MSGVIAGSDGRPYDPQKFAAPASAGKRCAILFTRGLTMSDQPKGQAGETASAGQTAAGTAAEARQTVTDAGRALAEQFTQRIAEMQSLVIPDVDALTTAHRRNMEALSAAYRAALEGTQAVARRNG